MSLWARLNELGPEQTERPWNRCVTPTFCLAGAEKAFGQGFSTWPIVSSQMAFKCKFPLGPKGGQAFRHVLLIWTNICCIHICIMEGMQNEGKLCQPTIKRRKKREKDWCHSVELHLQDIKVSSIHARSLLKDPSIHPPLRINYDHQIQHIGKCAMPYNGN